MLTAAQNERLTRVGPGTPCGNLLRQYWQPIALVDELSQAQVGARPVKAVRALGEDFVLFRDAQGKVALLDRACPHRGADLSYARLEAGGLRCPFHGWMFDANGKCVETPAEPEGSRLCETITQRSYPVVEKAGVYWAWFGDAAKHEPPAFPHFDCFTAPDSHAFAFKGLWECNWLQALEVGIDPAHASFLHRFFEDEKPSADNYGKQFRATSAGSQMPMTRLMRDYVRPTIEVETMPYGMRLTALRRIDETHTHVRVTNQIFPQAFLIPLSETMTITQWHLPVDDTRCYWVAVFTSFDKPIDKTLMRDQRLALYTLPDYAPRIGKHNQYGFDASEQATKTYTGMGFDINVHDQWAVESPGAIADRTKEHLGTSDKAIMSYRRQLEKAIAAVEQGATPTMALNAAQAATMTGPVTVDGVGPTGDKEVTMQYWRRVDADKRAGAPWAAPKVA